MVARILEWVSTRSASFRSRAPRSVGEMECQEGCLRAVRAAETAVSMSEGEAAWTEVMGVSSLRCWLRRWFLLRKDGCIGENEAEGEVGGAYVGFILSIFAPELDLTNSLLIKRPSGCSYLTPLGAVRVVKRSEDIIITSNSPSISK